MIIGRGSMTTTYGLPGHDSEIRKMEMTYSPDNLVKVWKVNVKAKVASE